MGNATYKDLSGQILPYIAHGFKITSSPKHGQHFGFDQPWWGRPGPQHLEGRSRSLRPA